MKALKRVEKDVQSLWREAEQCFRNWERAGRTGARTFSTNKTYFSISLFIFGCASSLLLCKDFL